jgi:fused signal recognition particle receptor
MAASYSLKVLVATALLMTPIPALAQSGGGGGGGLTRATIPPASATPRTPPASPARIPRVPPILPGPPRPPAAALLAVRVPSARRPTPPAARQEAG